MSTAHEQDTCATALVADDLDEVRGGLPGLGSLMAVIITTCATVPDACKKNEDTSP